MAPHTLECISFALPTATSKRMAETPNLQNSLISLMSRFSDGTAATACPCANKKVFKMKKNVRFAQDTESGEVRTQTVHIERCEDLEADVQDIWYTREEMRAIEWECVNIVQFFRQNKAYQQILMACLYPQQQDYKSQQQHHCYYAKDQALMEASFHVMAASDRARGLETQVLWGQHKQHVQSHRRNVLGSYKYSSYLMSMSLTMTSPSQSSSVSKDLLVRNYSEMESRGSVHFASLMGTFDAQEAALEYASSVPISSCRAVSPCSDSAPTLPSRR
mmetsp:Transcript_27691/g.64214  ORF Transcript_27691/g.64214 Transcript_27691/m.64214 type:complete len:276 (-) Transcript_27691:57-884(-)